MGGGFIAFLGCCVGFAIAVLICPKFYAPIRDYKIALKNHLTFGSAIPENRITQLKSNRIWFYSFLAISLILISNFAVALYLLKYPTRSMIESRNEALLSARSASRSAQCQSGPSALAAATIAVKGRLSDPGSAEFASINDPNTSITYVGKCMFNVISYVRSRNGFGGMNTVAYVARVRFNADSDRWNAESIDMKE